MQTCLSCVTLAPPQCLLSLTPPALVPTPLLLPLPWSLTVSEASGKPSDVLAPVPVIVGTIFFTTIMQILKIRVKNQLASLRGSKIIHFFLAQMKTPVTYYVEIIIETTHSSCAEKIQLCDVTNDNTYHETVTSQFVEHLSSVS